MTTRVVEQVAELLGDTIDRSHYLWRDGDRVKQHPFASWCDGTNRKANVVMHA